jgi:hypothetical protein
VVTPAISERAAAWLTALDRAAGVYCDVVLALGDFADAPLTRSDPLACSGSDFHLWSDAAKEGTPTPGLGGYMHGRYWSYELSRAELTLPIVVLEFVALVFNILIFAALAPVGRLIAHSDSLGSVQVWNRFSARSLVLQTAHLAASKMPEIAALGARLCSIEHVFGSGNDGADCPSRALYRKLEQLCAQLGCTARRVEAPATRIAEFLAELLRVAGAPAGGAGAAAVPRRVVGARGRPTGASADAAGSPASARACTPRGDGARTRADGAGIAVVPRSRGALALVLLAASAPGASDDLLQINDIAAGAGEATEALAHAEAE